MTPAELITAVHAAGATLQPEGAFGRVTGLAALPPGLVAALRQHRDGEGGQKPAGRRRSVPSLRHIMVLGRLLRVGDDPGIWGVREVVGRKRCRVTCHAPPGLAQRERAT